MELSKGQIKTAIRKGTYFANKWTLPAWKEWTAGSNGTPAALGEGVAMLSGQVCKILQLSGDRLFIAFCGTGFSAWCNDYELREPDSEEWQYYLKHTARQLES